MYKDPSIHSSNCAGGFRRARATPHPAPSDPSLTCQGWDGGEWYENLPVRAARPGFAAYAACKQKKAHEVRAALIKFIY